MPEGAMGFRIATAVVIRRRPEDAPDPCDAHRMIIAAMHEGEIQAGDTVVSSGYGGVVPPGIPVGVVADVKQDSTGFLKNARVVPAAPLPGALREVFIVR